jgi:hypothetical protein
MAVHASTHACTQATAGVNHTGVASHVLQAATQSIHICSHAAGCCVDRGRLLLVMVLLLVLLVGEPGCSGLQRHQLLLLLDGWVDG